MELKVTKEKVLEASEKCSTAKNIFKIMFPEVFEVAKPKYKAGDWLIHHDYLCSRIEEITSEKFFFINHLGARDWSALSYLHNSCRLATPEEIKEHLIAEAERRGYEGKKIIIMKGTCEGDASFDKLEARYYYYGGDKLEMGSSGCGTYTIYEKGKWAEILPTKLKLTKEMIAEKFGTTVHEIEIETT